MIVIATVIDSATVHGGYCWSVRRILRSGSIMECLHSLLVKSQPRSGKDETEKFNFVFVELTLLLLDCQS